MRDDDDTPGRLGQLILLGKVDSVDLASGRCVVSAGDVVTGPVRWIEHRAGATLTWSPPSVGEQVMLFCPEGEIAGAVALRGIYSDAHPAPGSTKRELIKFEDGALLAYDPEAHALAVVLPDGATVSIVAPGSVTIQSDGLIKLDGDVQITGDLQVDGKIHADDDIESDGDVKAGAISLTHHKHGNVAAGAAQTGEPV
ncbi:MAG: phage baseplate assembly protein V [Pseudomonadota bacterium]